MLQKMERRYQDQEPAVVNIQKILRGHRQQLRYKELLSQQKSQYEKQTKSMLSKFIPSYRYEIDKICQHLENPQMECELTGPYANKYFWKKPKEWLDLLGFNQKR